MKFVHIADMHFDSPFINLSDKEIQLKENITSYQVIATAGYRKEEKVVLLPCSFVWLGRRL